MICSVVECSGIVSVVLYDITRIAAGMPEKFGLLIDGWSLKSEHHIGVVGCYEQRGQRQYLLLVMEPLVADPLDDHSAGSHVAFLREMFRRDYNKRLENCLFVLEAAFLQTSECLH